MNRDEFLTRVREATISGRSHRVHAPPDGYQSAGYVGAGDDPAARLVSQICAAGGFGERVENLAAARERLAALLDQYDCRSAICWQHPLLERLQVDQLLELRHATCAASAQLAELDPAARRATILAADVGISSVTYAVAETGSLALAAGVGRERVISLCPPVHIALVEPSQIVADLFDLFAKFDPQDLPSNVTLITGPSKTGDIELRLTTGVHGPRAWHVLVLDRADA